MRLNNKNTSCGFSSIYIVFSNNKPLGILYNLSLNDMSPIKRQSKKTTLG